MTREQQQATRELEAAQDKWLKAYGWAAALGGRWAHPRLDGHYSRFDALQLTRAQPLVLGAAVYARRA